MSHAKLREALASGASAKEKGPPVADGNLTTTPDTAEAIEWRSRQSLMEAVATSSTFLDEDSGKCPCDPYEIAQKGHSTWILLIIKFWP